jgi:four helix bundle protein
MTVHRNLAVLDAANLVADDVNRLIARTPRLIHGQQLRDAAESVPSNIKEGFGRGAGADRAKFLRTSRGSAEETISQLRANRAAGIIAPREYWPLHHRLVTITRMIDELLKHPTCRPAPRPRGSPSKQDV